MAGPTIGEIAGIRGDAAIGGADAGVDIAALGADTSLPYLQAAAIANAAADKTIYDNFTKRLEAQLTSLSAIETKGVLNSDFKTITSQYGALLKDVYNNFGAIKNPQSNIEKSIELKTKEAALRSTIEQSKVQKLILDEHTDFLKAHPNWNTAANKAKIDAFNSAPIGAREIFSLDAPFNSSIEALAKVANASSTVDSATSELSNDGRYIKTTTGTTVNQDKFDQVLLSQMNSNDEYGNNLRKGFQDIFDAMAPAEQGKYTDLNDYVLKNGRAFMGLSSTKQVKLDENQVDIQDRNRAQTARDNAADRNLRQQEINLRRAAETSSKTELKAEELGSYKNQLLTLAFTTGKVAPSMLQDVYGDNNKVNKKTPAISGYNPKRGSDNEVLRDNKGREIPDLDSPITDGTSSEDLPRIEVKDTGIEAGTGNFVVYRMDNRTGKEMAPLVITPARANNDFNNILGPSKAAQVADGSRKYLKQKTGSENYNLIKAREIFGLPGWKKDSAPAAPAAKPTTKASSPVTKVKIPGL